MSDTPTPLWKQLLGAGTGALVALAAYVAYDAVSPSLAAVLTPTATIVRPAEPVVQTSSVAPMHDAATADQQKAQDNIANKAKALTDSFKGTTVMPSSGTGVVEATATGSAVSMEQTGTMAQQTSTEKESTETTTQTSSKSMTIIAGTKSDKLPNSGIGMWMGVLAAFSVALGLHLRRHAKVG